MTKSKINDIHNTCMPMPIKGYNDLVLNRSNKIPVGVGNQWTMNTNFAVENFDDPRDKRIQFLHGTTTLSFCIKDAVIIAVDSRASMGKYISFIMIFQYSKNEKMSKCKFVPSKKLTT